MGKLNYVYAYISIITAIATLGMDGYLVKEILEKPLKKNVILGTAFVLRLIALILSFTTILIIFYVLKLSNEYFSLYLVAALSIALSPFDLIDIEYQTKLQSKRTVIAKNTAYFFGAIFKLLLLIFKQPLIFFAVAMGVESLIAYCILVFQYQVTSSGVQIWKFNLKICGELLNKGWPFILSSVSVILYMRLDQIMLGNLLNSTAVGEFSAAVKVSEIFLFLPVAISSSYYATLMNSLNNNDVAGYRKKMQLLFKWMFLLSVIIALTIALFSKVIVSILYGGQYAQTAILLRIHIWSIIAIFLGVSGNQYLVLENLQKYSLYKTLIGLFTNVVLNLILIPLLGAIGCAIATLVSYFMSAIISNLFFTKTRILFQYQILSFAKEIKHSINDVK